MKGFLQDGNALFWERNREKMCIEPWGSDGLRVRASMGTDIQLDLPVALIDPPPTRPQIEIREDRAIIRKGDITAELLVAPVIYEGGQTITADAPLKRLPLYLRAEKILPIRA